MEPRVLFRTHYQVDEPSYLGVIVKSCTSPVQSAYDEVIAERLAQQVRSHRKDFNVAAAGYALDLARSVGVLNDQNSWTDKGHLVDLIATTPPSENGDLFELSQPDVFLFFRLFLDADGAALRFLATYLLRHQRIPVEDDDWNSLAASMFLEVFTEYLQLTSTTPDRVTLRSEIDRIRARGYTGKSGPHKMFVHLQTMYRLGLIERSDSGSSRVYQLGPESAARLGMLLDAIPNARILEEIVRDRSWADVAAAVYGVQGTKELDPEELLRLLIPKYERIAGQGVPVCPLPSVLEAIQIELFADRAQRLSYKAAIELIERVRVELAPHVRYHVDRRGIPAFIKLSEELRAKYRQPGDALASP